MSDTDTTWNEETSRTFLDIADVAVPGRREQMEMLWSLVPAGVNDEFIAVELCCGAGLLTEGVLERFPRSRVLALDGSEMMLEEARRRLSRFGDRAEVRAIELDGWEWLGELPSSLRCVLSSLAIHHLDGGEKRRLFREICARLEPGGTLLIADVVKPASETARAAAAAAWHRVAREQSLAFSGSLETYERAVAEGWHPEAAADPIDKPNRLYEQLKWLEEAGFSTVDCFWMRAGQAIYGGYR